MSTLLIVLLLILLNALYVAAEFAIIGARVSRVQQYAREGSALATALVPIVSSTVRVDTYIAVSQIGITVSSLALGAFGQATFGLMLADILIDRTTLESLSAHAIAALAVLIVLTSVQVVFGELLPKSVALQYPVRVAMYTYHAMRWSHLAFRPFIGLLNGSGAFILRRIGISGERSHRHVHAPEEIEMLVRESREGGHIEEKQRVRLQRTLQLSRRSVRQIMVPRRQIASVDLDSAAATVRAELAASPFTRLVATRGSLDEVEGYLHTKDVAVAMATGRSLTDLRPLVRPLCKLSCRLTVDEVLNQLRRRRTRLALITDPLGDIEGLVSIEDVMRELVGGLSDEFKHDVGRPAPVSVAPGIWHMPGRMSVDELSEWALAAAVEPLWLTTTAPTLAGWLIEQVGRLPDVGQTIRMGQLAFTVEQLDGVAIERVRVEVRDSPAGADDA